MDIIADFQVYECNKYLHAVSNGRGLTDVSGLSQEKHSLISNWMPPPVFPFPVAPEYCIFDPLRMIL